MENAEQLTCKGLCGESKGDKGLPSQKTNGDRIRAMSDKELAEWILDMQKHDISVKWCNKPACFSRLDDETFDCTDDMLMGCVIRWLSQPCKGEHP